MNMVYILLLTGSQQKFINKIYEKNMKKLKNGGKILTIGGKVIEGNASSVMVDLSYLLELDDTVVNYQIVDSKSNYNFTYPNGRYGGIGVDGKMGKCIKFVDSDTYPHWIDNIYVEGLNNIFTFNKTYSLWIKRFSNESVTMFFHCYGSSGGESTDFYFGADNNTNKLRVQYISSTPNASYTFIFNKVIELDTWYHIVIRFNGYSNNLNVFVNGLQYNYYGTGTGDTVLLENYIYYGGSNYYIDQVASWNRSLLYSEISYIYNNNKGLPYSQW